MRPGSSRRAGAARSRPRRRLPQLQGQLADADDRAAARRAEVDAQIQTIPGTVDAEVARPAPKTDKLYFKGITLTLGGFAAVETVYRAKNNIADIGSNYSEIPYDNVVARPHRRDALHGASEPGLGPGPGQYQRHGGHRLATASSTSWPRSDRQLEREQLLQPAHPQPLRHARLEGRTGTGTSWPARAGRWRR